MDITGSVDDDRERVLYSELANYKANTPEWLDIRRKIVGEREARFEEERKKLIICKGC